MQRSLSVAAAKNSLPVDDCLGHLSGSNSHFRFADVHYYHAGAIVHHTDLGIHAIVRHVVLDILAIVHHFALDISVPVVPRTDWYFPTYILSQNDHVDGTCNRPYHYWASC